jgi:adenylate cyclase
MRRAAVYAVLSALLLTEYGTKVCPFLAGLPRATLLLCIGTALGLMLAVRPLLLDWLERRFPRPVEEQVRRQLHVDVGSFAAVGAALTLYNHVVYRFPLESGLKLFVGCALLGTFYGLDLALESERRLVEAASRGGHRLPASWQLRSLTRGFATVAVLVLALVGAVFVLIISKDLAWLVNLGSQQLRTARLSILREVGFVMAVTIALSINLILSYARNLRVFFARQTRVLGQVADGNLDGYVPVVGKSEFAFIADHTNRMIDALRDKRHIESVLGKVVSPEIARRLLAAGPEGVSLGGSRRDLVILFSDIRSFTSYSEGQPPEAVVQLLNTYFAVMVRLVREHGGLVDKFIGDGMLAVFGLDDPQHAASRAVQAGVAMLAACQRLAAELAMPLAIGVGVHRGEVIAGNVGAPERLEFTFIGDVVNTAARLEGVTQKLQAPLVVSQAVHDDLGPAEAALPWLPLGEQPLKGKAVALRLFGLRPAAPTTPATQA